MPRKARLIIIGIACAILFAFLAAHTPPVRAVVLRRVTEALRSSYGIDLRAASLSYNLLTLSAELHDVQVAAVDTPAEPFAAAAGLGISFAVRSLIGDLSVTRLSIASPRIHVRRGENGTDNLPRVTSGRSTNAGVALPPIRLDDLAVSFQQPSASVAIRGATLELTSVEPGRLSVSFKAQHGVAITAGHRTIAVDAAAGRFDIEGQRLDIRELTASRPGTELRATGGIAFGGETSAVDLTVNGSSDVGWWWTSFIDEAGPVGHVRATARVMGSLPDPAITFEINSRSLEWSGTQASAIRAAGGYSGGQLTFDTVTLGVAGGTVEGHGTIALADARRASRVAARWVAVDAAQLPGAAGLAGTIAKSGTAVVEWRADGTSATPHVEVTATSGVVASGTMVPVVVHGSGHGNRWHVKASPGDPSAVDLTATADIGLDPRRWQASTIDGRVVVRATSLETAIRQAQTFGVGGDIDPATAGGVIDLDATLDGTLGGVRSTGRIIGRALTLAGGPPLDVDASFAVDAAGKTSSGTFHALAPGLERATFASASALTLGGSLIAAGTWSGPLSDPAIDATVTVRNLSLRHGGSAAVIATGGTFDGVLKGPATNLGGEGRLAIGSVEIDGRSAGAIVADLTLAGRTVHAQARAPTVKTALDVSVGLENPNAFEGHGTLADCDIETLLTIAGLAAADAGAVRGRISSSVAFKGDLRHLPATTVTVDVAPIDATIIDVPIAMSRGLSARLAIGRIQVDEVAMTIGGLAVRVGGTLATDRSTGKLRLDVDGDLGSFAPWVTRLTGTSDVAAAGRLTGHVETEVSPTGLATTGTVHGTLTTLSKGDRLLAKDVRAAIVLTGQRAEVRDATGAVLGGQLTATTSVPLSWLNQWLPSGWQIAHQPMEAPATLEGKASFDVPALFGLFGRTPLESLGGSIDLAAKLSAPRPDAAAIAGDLWLERLEASANELKYAQSDVTRFRLSGGALTVETLDLRGPGSQVIGRGRFGLIEGVETDLRLDVDTELGIVGALLAGRATGRVDGHIALRGQRGAVRVTSDVTLRDASWLIPGQRILFAGWSGHLQLADQALSVTRLGGTVNGGTIRIDGQLPFEAGAAGGGLTIAASDILVDVPRGLHSQLSADLVWQRGEPARLQGKAEITSNRYTEPVTRILQLVNEMSSATRPSGESTLPPWLARTALDISLVVTDPILIDNSVSTVELMPDLRLGGTVDSPALSGRVDVVDDGRVTIGGRTYRLRDSQVRFAPADGLVPTLDAVGDTRIGDYDVTIRISGTPDRIETSYSSIPPLGERELRSLIVTGRAGEQTTQSRQSEDSFAAAAAATDILGFAGKFVGLDSVRVGAADLDLVSKDVSTAQHLTVSKSLGSSFELIFSDNLEDGSVTWVLVWKPTSVNEIRASSVEDGTRALEFRRSFVFGPGTPSGTRTARRAAATQPRVDTVRITGTPGFSDADLFRKLDLSAGDRFDVRQWIEDRHRLERFYLDRGYNRVRITSTRAEDTDRSTISLTYEIQRGPQTVIETVGDPLPGQVIEDMYEAWRGLPIADVVGTEFERIAREGLARRGYYRPTVQIDFGTETPDLARVTIQVARGPQTRRLAVAWSGNRDVSNAELDALVARHRAESEVWLDAQSIAWEVRQLYASRGHLQCQVTVGEPVFQDPDATLPIAIDEGVLSRLVDVQLEGVDPARRTAGTQALGLAIGEPLSAAAPMEATRRLKTFYAGLGYQNAAIAHTLTTAKDGSVSIAWTVKEGPLYRVKDVNVVGVETTSDGLVRKAIALEPGDAMSQSALDATRHNLYEIGSFRRVDFAFGDASLQSPGSGELPLTLTIQAEEPQRFQLKYGVQFSFDRSTGTGSGTALGGSVELRDRNFIGRAVQASVGAHWDPDLQTIALLFSSPRVFGKRIRTNVYVRDRREQDVPVETTSLEGATLDDRRREATFEQRWRPAPAFELVWGYTVSSRRFLINQEDQHLDTEGLLAGPVFSVIVDKRDSPFDASRGLFHSSSFQFGVQSLGSDLGYLRYLLRQSYYQPLGRLTAAGSVRYGTIQEYSGTAPISIIDLFFNAGGTSTVRGYPEDSLSAINVAGFALGGTDLLILNGELRFPISRLFGGAAFVDAGNTFASIADLKLGSLALGAGLGLRVRTPLAPLRLDVAYPFSDAYGRRGVRVHFSIGQMF